MAADIQTPICEATSLPLPILPTEPDQRARFLYNDFHHHFHPRNSPELTGLAGQAVRFSRGQDIARFLHNRYHDLFTGPALPISAEEKFRLTVLACAGVVPREAIDLSKSGTYERILLTDDQFETLAAPRSIHIDRAYKPDSGYYKRKVIGRFFAAYALQQNVRQAVSDKVIEQFMDETTIPVRRNELGNLILKEALGMSVDSLLDLHRDLRIEGYVLRNRAIGLPEVLRKFFIPSEFSKYHDEMARRLANSSSLQTGVNELELAS